MVGAVREGRRRRMRTGAQRQGERRGGAGTRWRSSGRAVSAQPHDSRSSHEGRTAPRLIWTRMVADTETPVSALLKLTQPGRGDFLLESVEGGAARGRYSLIGLDPDLVFREIGRAPGMGRGGQYV